MRLKGVTDGRQVVVWDGKRFPCVIGWHAGRIGLAKGQRARAGLHQQPVGVAVVAAIEFDEHVATRCGPGQAQCGHGGFGAGGDEADQIDTWKRLLDQVSEFDFGLGGCAEAGAAGRGILNGGDDAGVGVAGDQRAPGGEVVDITIAIDVPDG